MEVDEQWFQLSSHLCLECFLYKLQILKENFKTSSSFTKSKEFQYMTILTKIIFIS